MVEHGAQLVDVRAEHEWEAGHIDGALHLPLAELASERGDRQGEAGRFYCRGGNARRWQPTLWPTRLRRDEAQRGIVGWAEAG